MLLLKHCLAMKPVQVQSSVLKRNSRSRTMETPDDDYTTHPPTRTKSRRTGRCVLRIAQPVRKNHLKRNCCHPAGRRSSNATTPIFPARHPSPRTNPCRAHPPGPQRVICARVHLHRSRWTDATRGADRKPDGQQFSRARINVRLAFSRSIWWGLGRERAGSGCASLRHSPRLAELWPTRTSSRNFAAGEQPNAPAHDRPSNTGTAYPRPAT